MCKKIPNNSAGAYVCNIVNLFKLLHKGIKKLPVILVLIRVKSTAQLRP